MIFLHIDYVIMYYDYRLLFVRCIYVRLIAVLKFLLHFVVRKRTVSFVKREVPRGNRWKFEKIIILTNLSSSYFLSDEICCEAEHFEQLFPMRIPTVSLVFRVMYMQRYFAALVSKLDWINSNK